MDQRRGAGICMTPATEAARLDALRGLDLLDTDASETFDRITRMASQLFDLPISAISLTDSERQWFKSRVGIEHTTIPRHRAPCAEVATTRNVLVIEDILADDVYSDSVLADQGIRFYAGAPLITRDGHGLGSLCVLGTAPRIATAAELGALSDLAAMVMSQIELQHAFGRIEPLSGLPNRVQFFEDIEDLGRDSNGTQRLAVLIDLARIDQISNGTRVLGTGYVDQIVKTAARLLRTTIGPTRKGYHVAATQFAFLAPAGVEEQAYVDKLTVLLAELHDSSATGFMMTAAIGVAPFVLGQVSATDVLRRAHSAALDARGSGRAVSLYSVESDIAHRRRYRLLNDFGDALTAKDQLRLVFQPRIDLVTRRCVGAEALLRWSHPQLGNIAPSEFIPIVEQTTMARPATAWVIDRALRQIKAWEARGLRLLLAVNVSAANLEEADFAHEVQLALMKHGVRPGCLELELTESAVMQNGDRALDQLKILSESGIRLAIDDFGTGYSSLAYLQRLPADVVKIDRSFVADLDKGDKERLLVRTMIQLSHDLGYRVVGEGVETAAIQQQLIEMNCDEAQGYFIARPLEADALEVWMENDRRGLPLAS
jgi:EAL domain-containing protein (putative c-di-GMP-specific phosphodiesterase class I)/GGDEF domain-containing protein